MGRDTIASSPSHKSDQAHQNWKASLCGKVVIIWVWDISVSLLCQVSVTVTNAWLMNFNHVDYRHSHMFRTKPLLSLIDWFRAVSKKQVLNIEIFTMQLALLPRNAHHSQEETRYDKPELKLINMFPFEPCKSPTTEQSIWIWYPDILKRLNRGGVALKTISTFSTFRKGTDHS